MNNMKFYKLTMDMDRENDIVCHFDKQFNIPQNTLITGKYYDKWDDKLTIYYSMEEGNIWTDYLANDKGWFLVSDKLKRVLEFVNSDIQFLKVTVEEYKNTNLVKEYYLRMY